MAIYILGNGGFSEELFEQFFLTDTDNDFGGFIIMKDDKTFVTSEKGITPFEYSDTAQFMLGTGHKIWRKKFLDYFSPMYPFTQKHFPNMYSKRAFIAKSALVGCGNIFCAFSILNAKATIGNFNTINIYSSINHDCVVGDYNILSPYCGIMGYAKLGNTNFLGTNSIITPKVVIGDDNTISAGECVFDDLGTRVFFQSGVTYSKP